MMVHTALFTKLMRKQITSMSNPSIPANYQENPKVYLKRLSHLSSTKEIFENSKDYCKQCNILWFNPLSTLFLHLINKYFPPTHKYKKIFNRNTIKISYSCMPNIKSKIITHNKKNIK